jgi:hypothetical protein
MKLFSVNFSFKLLKIEVPADTFNSIADYEVRSKARDNCLLELQSGERN